MIIPALIAILVLTILAALAVAALRHDDSPDDDEAREHDRYWTTWS